MWKTLTCRVHASADLSQRCQRLLDIFAVGPHGSLTSQRRQGRADIWHFLLTGDAQSRRDVNAGACRQQPCGLDDHCVGPVALGSVSMLASSSTGASFIAPGFQWIHINWM